MKRTIEIVYRWWRDGGKKVKASHVEALEERAQDRIFAMVAEGYRSGELYDNIHMTDRDPEDGIEYSGWWELE